MNCIEIGRISELSDMSLMRKDYVYWFGCECVCVCVFCCVSIFAAKGVFTLRVLALCMLVHCNTVTAYWNRKEPLLVCFVSHYESTCQLFERFYLWLCSKSFPYSLIHYIYCNSILYKMHSIILWYG